MLTKKRFFGVIAAVVVMAVLTGGYTFAAGQGEGEKAGELLKVGYLPFAGFGPIYVAEMNGWFDDEGVNVDLILFDSGPPLLEAMAAGEIEVGALGGVPTLRTAGREVFDMRIISVEADVSGFTKIVSDSSIKSIEGLRGKKVSAPWATTSHYLLGRALEQYGMTMDDIELIEMEVLDAQAAFVAGKIDACVPAPSAIDKILESREDAHVLFASEDFKEPVYIYDLWVAPESILDSRAEDVEKVLKVFHGKTVQYMTSPSTSTKAAQDMQEWMSDVVGAEMGIEEVERQVNLRKYFTIEEMKELFETGKFQQMLEDQVDFLMGVDILDTVPNFDKVMDSRIIDGL
jgi:sulfonate transport system substrate-binding protein